MTNREYRSFDRLEQAPQLTGASMAKRGSRPADQYGRRPPRPSSECGAGGRVDAPVNRAKPSRGHHPVDRAGAEAGFERLPPCDYPMLATRQPANDRSRSMFRPAPGQIADHPTRVAQKSTRVLRERWRRARRPVALPSRNPDATRLRHQHDAPASSVARATPRTQPISPRASQRQVLGRPAPRRMGVLGRSGRMRRRSGSAGPRDAQVWRPGRESAASAAGEAVTAGCCRAFASAGRRAWSAGCEGRGSASGGCRGGR